eukprot:2227351-Rhodomonas_salina.4
MEAVSGGTFAAARAAARGWCEDAGRACGQMERREGGAGERARKFRPARTEPAFPNPADPKSKKLCKYSR